MTQNRKRTEPSAPPMTELPTEIPAVSADFTEIMALVREASIPRDIAPELLYRCAGFGALALLEDALRSDDPNGAAALIETVLRSPSASLQARAATILTSHARAGRALATEALFTLAIDELRLDLLLALRENRLVSVRPTHEAGKLLFLKEIKKLRAVDPCLTHLTRLFRVASDALRGALLSAAEKPLSGWRALAGWIAAPDDPKARENLIRAFPTLSAEERAAFFAETADGSESTGHLLADLYLSHDDARVRERLGTIDARPSDPRDDAIYYFLIENWERYRESDAAYRAILRVFDGPDKTLQLRLITVGTMSGENAWIAALNPDERLLSAPSVFGPDDWIERMNIYAQSSEWDKLWTLTLSAPAALTRDAYARLHGAAFSPKHAEETDLYRRALRYVPSVSLPFPPRPIAMVQHVAGPILSMRISPDGTFLAFISGSGKLLALRSAEPTNPNLRVELMSAVPRLVEFTSGGQFLISYWSDQTFRVFNLTTGLQTQQFPAPSANLVAFRVRADDRRLLLVESDGTVREVSFPTGVELYRETSLMNRRLTHAAYDDAKGRLLLVGEDGGAVLFDLNRKIPLSTLQLSAPIHVLSSAIVQDWLVTASGSRLILTHAPTGNRLFDVTLTDGGTTRVLSAEFDAETGCVLALMSDGRAVTLRAPSGKIIADGRPVSPPERTLTMGSSHFPTRKAALFDGSGRMFLSDLTDWRLSLLPTDRISPDELSLPGGDPAFRTFTSSRVEYQRRFEIDLDLDAEDFGDDGRAF